MYLAFGFALALANAPFLGERVLLFFRKTSKKTVFVRLLELAFFYCALVLVLFAEEARVSGGTYKQDWEFFIVTASVFLVASYPGFVYRYFWKLGT
jgi:hypothetical protein